MIVGHVSPIPAVVVEDKVRLQLPQIYPNAVLRIGEFGDCAASIVIFLTELLRSARLQSASCAIHQQTIFRQVRLRGRSDI